VSNSHRVSDRKACGGGRPSYPAVVAPPSFEPRDLDHRDPSGTVTEPALDPRNDRSKKEVSDDSVALIKGRPELSETEMQYVAKLVAAAPPLTDNQKAQLRPYLSGARQ
jgi:hypothetical protein